MTGAELIERLRKEGGFRWLPLLGTTGQVTGVHLTRFLPGGHLDVVQAWDERWAAWARLSDAPDADAPFTGPQCTSVVSGAFAQVAAKLLPLQPCPDEFRSWWRSTGA
ncbi:hypothetical protein Lesp02_72220 [Lentzea sp. NBRC 105346]|uniref:hypothetical protein n=1 Tax=Lentzea sp. NBRC 105346 TaxID=3032205 RepID=UPI00249FCF5B|nr:hypothetical protein [Lentzea sp. NBRC 105346]GLZ35035.1 hypothetical protein Lesp02_72220 [Lentzea sp. NBRC 105346]